jgi:hypothetical protein
MCCYGVHAKCIDGQQDEAKRRIEEAISRPETRTADHQP